jgi:hypothetical protein
MEGIVMKRLKICTVLILLVCLLVGCAGREVFLTAKNVKVNTIVIKKDGRVQSSVVEDFDKDYYSKEELDEFINVEIEKYNEGLDAEAVVLASLDYREDKVLVVFTYASFEDYCAFNDVKSQKLTVAKAEERGLLPDTFSSVKDSETVEKDIVLENEKYNVLTLNEEYDVIVEGAIKYYSNAQLLNSTTVQTKSDSTAVIVYK